MLVEMPANGPGNDAPEPYGDGVSNLTCQMNPVDGRTRFQKLEGTRKGLQECCLTDRERTVLFGMAEPSVSNANALSRNHRPNIVPRHPAINASE